MNNRRLSTRKTIQVLVILTILVWATQTLLRQWGHGGRDHVLLAGISSPDLVQTPAGRQFVQGSMQNTGCMLDVAIEGEGFFSIKLPEGEAERIGYTRAGDLFVGANGHLLVGIGNGYELTPVVKIPKGATHIQIAQNGFITGMRAGSASPVEIGQIRLTRFADQEGLQKVGDLIYQPTAVSGPPMEMKPDRPGSAELLQNFLESNTRP